MADRRGEGSSARHEWTTTLIERKLYPNVDFYSGITLRALAYRSFPNNILTVFFAIARTVGWVAQWNDMVEDETQRAGHPASSMRERCRAGADNAETISPRVRGRSTDLDRGETDV